MSVFLLCCRLVYNDKGMVISKQIDVLLVTYRREIFGVHNSEVVLMCVIGETKRKKLFETARMSEDEIRR